MHALIELRSEPKFLEDERLSIPALAMILSELKRKHSLTI